jgi:dolichol-phosphate mannosyltransferase
MGSRYLFICLYVWLEKTLSRGDYKKSVSSTPLALPEAETASSAKTP